MARQGDGRAHLPGLQRRALRATRLLFTIAGKSIYDLGELNFDELHAFLGTVKPPAAAPMPAGRCSTRSAAGWSCCWASAWTT